MVSMENESRSLAKSTQTATTSKTGAAKATAATPSKGPLTTKPGADKATGPKESTTADLQV